MAELFAADYIVNDDRHPKDMTAEELWQQYGRWIIKVCLRAAKRYKQYHIDYWDLYSVAFEAFQKSASRWSPDKGANILTFSYTMIYWDLRRYIDGAYVKAGGKPYRKDFKQVQPRVLSSDSISPVDDEDTHKPAWIHHKSGMAAARSARMLLEYNNKTTELQAAHNHTSEYGGNPEELAIALQEMRQVLSAAGSRTSEKQAAEKVLLDGLTPTEVGQSGGTSRQNYHQAIKRVISRARGEKVPRKSVGRPRKRKVA